jgi:Fic-DOC domain mobile mystery protein B
MSKFEIEYPPGSTPLNSDEIEGLIPDYITTNGELNALEKENILEATAWAYGKKHSDILNASFCFELHKKMLCNVWRWAGKQRWSNKSIGVSKEMIGNELKNLLDDTQYWIKSETYALDEISARFHQRLVWIHAFVNGNGRHSRLMTDILLRSQDQAPFTWGNAQYHEIKDVEGIVKKQYISALKEADGGNFEPLIKFARS